MFLTTILCLGCLLLLWLDGPGFAAAALAVWRLWSDTILAIIFVRAIFFIFNNKWFFRAPFIISGSFSESILLCKSWSNFAAIVIRISVIPSSLSSPVLFLSDSASINISWSSISISGCLLVILTDISLCSSFDFFISLFLLQKYLTTFYLPFFFLFLDDLFLVINFY